MLIIMFVRLIVHFLS